MKRLIKCATGNPAPGLIFHSDRGSQYAGRMFQRIVVAYDLVQSMSRKGGISAVQVTAKEMPRLQMRASEHLTRFRWDNAPTESFFTSLKKEMIRKHIYTARDQAKMDIFRYIEGYYNNFRLHSFLDYHTPVEFEEKMAA